MKTISPITINANPTVTLTRTGTAWYWDYAGVLQSVGSNVLRYHWDKETHDFLGVLIEASATNYIWNNATFTTQTRTGLPVGKMILSFYGTGSVKITSGAAGSPTLSGAGTPADQRKTLVVTTNSSSVTFTVTGTCTYGQFEGWVSDIASSVIVTAGANVTRNQDVLSGTGMIVNGFTDATAAYAGGTTYALDAVIQYGGRLYKSLQNSNTGHQPDTSPTWWEDTGPNNVTAAFDGQIGTKSRGQSQEELIVMKCATPVDAVGLFNMDNVSFTQVIISGGYMTGHAKLSKSLYPTQAALTSPDVSHYFVTIVFNNGISGVPPAGYDYAGVGEIVIGAMEDLGETEAGMQVSMIDYSRKVTDEFGVTTLVERPATKRLSANIRVPKASFNTVMEKVFSLRATPTMWIGSDDADYASASVYGFVRDYRTVINYPTYSLSSIEIEEIV